MVTCLKCDECGMIATKDLEWHKTISGGAAEEVLICICGNRQWKFVEKHESFIGPNVLVINRSKEAVDK